MNDLARIVKYFKIDHVREAYTCRYSHYAMMSSFIIFLDVREIAIPKQYICYLKRRL